MSYRDYGYSKLPPISPEQCQREMERIQRQDDERARNHRAWLRLCGMAAPIGGLSER